jgi:hypothetical protein
MPITIDTPSTLRTTQATALDVRPDANRVQFARTMADVQAQTSIALNKIQGAINYLENLLRQANSNQFENLFITGPGGAVIGWIGTYQGYQGAWFKQLYVGATGPDTAPFFADVDGNVIIGKNGSISIQDQNEDEVGFIGVETEAQKVITAATNATPPVITINAHGYNNGDTVFLSGATGNTAINGYRLVKNVTPNTFEITNLAGVNIIGNGAYAGPGRAARYYAGGWFQAFAAGGTGFADAKIRSYVDGQLKITDALITLTDIANNGYIELNPSTGPSAIFRNTLTGIQTRIESGFITVENYITPAQDLTINPSSLLIRNPSLDPNVFLQAAFGGYGVVTVYDAAGSGTASMNGEFGRITGEYLNANTSLEVAGTQIVDAGLNAQNLTSVDSAAYLVGGTPGVSDSFTVVTAITPTTGSAVDSVDFIAQTTTSTTVVTGLSISTKSVDFTSGLFV